MNQTIEKISVNGIDYVRADQVPSAPPQEPAEPLTVGNAVFVRCVTHYYTGRVAKVTAEQIILTDAAWIADTGRFAAALTSGTLGEVEPYPDPVSIARGAVVDVTTWRHALPRTVK